MGVLARHGAHASQLTVIIGNGNPRSAERAARTAHTVLPPHRGWALCAAATRCVRSRAYLVGALCVVLAPLVGLVGAATGFYYGGKSH